MFTSCYNCDFFVNKNDEFCFNCGSPDPALDLFWAKVSLIRLLFVIFIYSVLFYLYFFVLFDSSYFALFFVAFFVVILSSLTEYIFVYKQKNTFNSLNNKESIISKRLKELNSRNHNINKILEQITESDTADLQSVKSKLIGAKGILNNQYDRYKLQKQKINLIRIQNKLSPILSNFQNLSDEEIYDGLTIIEESKNEVNSVRENISDNVPAEFFTKYLPERDDFLEQLSETEVSYSKLRESLINQQATNTLKNITDFGESLDGNNELAHAVETFNANTEILNLSESFEQLENEYKRLKTENDISKSLLIE